MDEILPAERTAELIRLETTILQKTPIRTIHFFQTLGSTNDYAKELLKSQDLPLLESTGQIAFPLLIHTQEQTAGRGRGAKKWWTGKDSLAFSLVLKLSDLRLQRENLTSLSPFVAEAVAETIRYNTTILHPQSPIPNPQSPISVHPPNDVYMNDKKVSGILIESPKPDYAIIGIGVNTNNTIASVPCEFQNVPITTLFDEFGTKIDHVLFLTELLQRLFHFLTAPQ